MTLREPGSILLISCYELGHQPLGVALPLGFLERAGFAPAAVDIAVEDLDPAGMQQAAFVGISVPMHTALRLGVRLAEGIRRIAPDCHICFYGLYAALNSEYLLEHGADSCIGGEYEGRLVELVESIERGSQEPIPGVIRSEQRPSPVLEKLDFVVPSRSALPPLSAYARLEQDGDCRVAGYVEASRGCRHLCTHCPIPPVYNGRFFVMPQQVVLDDIRRQVAAGATHITFGDPDFLNGPQHALRVVRAMHAEFPDLTYDFTAKVEHLISRGEFLSEFAACGCLFIITAVESLSERVLKILDKQHSLSDVTTALQRVHNTGIALRPTWVSFTPWTTLSDFREMLDFVESQGLIDHVDPVQYSIRLLVPPGSWLADHPEMLPHRGALDDAAFTYRWAHPDPQMDQLQQNVARLVEDAAQAAEDPVTTFYRLKCLVDPGAASPQPLGVAEERQRVPRLTESWFC